MKRYTTINTFVDDAFKSHVRENILNPMIVQHNEMGEAITSAEMELLRHEERINDVQHNMVTRLADLSDVPAKIANRYLGTNSSGGLMWKEGPTGGGEGGGPGGDVDLTPVLDQLDDHENRISAIEMGGGSGEGGSVDLSPILGRLTVNEGEIDDLQTSSADHETRLAAVEAGGGNGGGSEGGSVFVKDHRHNMPSVKAAYTAEDVIASSYLALATGSTNTVQLPLVNTSGASTVPGGKEISVVSLGAITCTITPGTGQKIYFDGSPQDSVTLGHGESIVLLSVLNGKSFRHWIVQSYSKAASDIGGGNGGGGGNPAPLPEGVVPVTNLSMNFKSTTDTYTAADVMTTSFLNVRAANTTITLPPVKTDGNGTTEAKGGEVRYICAYENSVTLAGGTAGDGQQNVSWGGTGTATKVIPKGTTVGLVAVAIDTGDWSNWQVFSEVASQL